MFEYCHLIQSVQLDIGLRSKSVFLVSSLRFLKFFFIYILVWFWLYTNVSFRSKGEMLNTPKSSLFIFWHLGHVYLFVRELDSCWSDSHCQCVGHCSCELQKAQVLKDALSSLIHLPTLAIRKPIFIVSTGTWSHGFTIQSNSNTDFRKAFPPLLCPSLGIPPTAFWHSSLCSSAVHRSKGLDLA